MSDQETEWAALLRAANAGDGRAYARFLHAITPVLRGIVRAKGRALRGDPTEDIVQEVLLAIHLKRHTWRDDCPVRPWLFAITRHKVVDAFRARGAQVQLPIEDFAETGRRMAMTEGAVRVALHRAMKRLAELRERHME